MGVAQISTKKIKNLFFSLFFSFFTITNAVRMNKLMSKTSSKKTGNF